MPDKKLHSDNSPAAQERREKSASERELRENPRIKRDQAEGEEDLGGTTEKVGRTPDQAEGERD